MELIRFGIGIVLLVVSAALAVQLWAGRWQFLIAKPTQTKKGTFFPEGTKKIGQRVAWVMVACFAVTSTLLAFGMAQMTGNIVFLEAATLLNNITLVAYCLSIVWTLFSLRSNQSYREYFKSTGGRLFALVLATCAALTLLSILFS